MIIDLKDLALIKTKEAGKKIVLATGTFDLFHYEHLKYLEGAKKQGDILVVAVKSNQCAALKGKNRPIIDEIQRSAIVNSIRPVDYVVIARYEESDIPYDNQKQKEWLNMFENVFKLLRPDILYYENNPVLKTARHKIFQKYHVKGVLKERGKMISTTEIIEKVNRIE